MDKKCPRCGADEFLVTPHVTQDWRVDGKGNCIDVIQPCVEVVHAPDDDDVWNCAVCGYSGPGSNFDPGEPFGAMDHETVDGKKVFTRIVPVPAKTYADILKALSSPGHMGEDDTISVTAKFPGGFEMDVKCCGSRDETAWTEAVLFQDGSECGCTDPSDEFLGEWELECDGTRYAVKVVPERCFDLPTVRREFGRGTIKLKSSPNGDGIVCAIGSNWFYFSGPDAEKYSAPSLYRKNVAKADITRAILDALDDMRLTEDLMDEYLYYAYYVAEHRPKEDSCPDGEVS